MAVLSTAKSKRGHLLSAITVSPFGGLIVASLLLGSCANQSMPKLLGTTDGVTLWSIDGFTAAGKLDEADARAMAIAAAEFYCRSKAEIRELKTEPTHAVVGISWFATYSCIKSTQG